MKIARCRIISLLTSYRVLLSPTGDDCNYDSIILIDGVWPHASEKEWGRWTLLLWYRVGG